MRAASSIDTLILGAGPAGTSAAIQCAKAGLNVTLIERMQFPRERPGETLHPGIESLLNQLEVAQQTLTANLLRHEGVWVEWESDRRFVSFGADECGTWQGFQVWRADFDTSLLCYAKHLGVRVIQPCYTLAPIIEDNRVVGVTTSKGAFRSTFTIDATGSQSWLAKKLGLTLTSYTPRLTAYYGYAMGECPQCHNAPAIVADPQGWTWTAKVCPHLYQWTRLPFYNQCIAKGWMPEEFSHLTSRGKLRAADVTWRIVNNPAGLGYFLVGDAASVLDPAASHGLLKAIMCGMMVGCLITQILHHTQTERKVIEGYCQWIYNWFQHDRNRLKQLYINLPNPPNWL